MRRTIALTLMMINSLMLIALIFGPGADANLPPCCRRHGAHHCMMLMFNRYGDKQTGFTSVSEKCRYFPVSIGAVRSRAYKPETGKQVYTEVVRHLSCAPKHEALNRVSFLRSHQKRGPPAPLA
jgi:hypothetical protein